MTILKVHKKITMCPVSKQESSLRLNKRLTTESVQVVLRQKKHLHHKSDCNAYTFQSASRYDSPGQKHCHPAALGAVAALCVSSSWHLPFICHRQRAGVSQLTSATRGC